MAAKTIKWDDLREQMPAAPEVNSEYDVLEDKFNTKLMRVFKRLLRSIKF